MPQTLTNDPVATPGVPPPPPGHLRGDRERFERFVRMVKREIGVTLTEAKRGMVETRLRRRFTALGLTDFAAYLRHLEDPAALAAERDAIYVAVTTNKTDFFREPSHFEHLAEVALPAAVARASARQAPVKIWSAAASTGAEAWTAAIVAAEHARVRGPFDWRVIGTDVNSEVLRTAREAVYPNALLEPVPAALRAAYFRGGTGARGGQARVIPALRRRVRFHQLNLLTDRVPVDRDIDVIFLRNVLIYFDSRDQKRVIELMARHLAPGGVLYLGHSEGMMMQSPALIQIATATFRKPG